MPLLVLADRPRVLCNRCMLYRPDSRISTSGHSGDGTAMTGISSLSPLGIALRHRKVFVEIDDLATWKRCRVQLHAQGVVLRDTVLGSEIRTKKQQVCRTGDFLVAEIDAKHGGYGMVPKELDGAIVSSHYFLFEVDQTILDRRFLGYFARTPYFGEQVAAQGSTNYAAIRPSHVLGYQIPLPPLAEQRRIVARIEELAARIEEARALRREADDETHVLTTRVINDIQLERWDFIRLGDILREGTQNGLSARPSPTPPGVPILRISAGTSRADAVVDEDDVRYVEIMPHEAEKYALHPGDLLACRFNGNLRFVGKFSIYEGYRNEHRVYPDKLIRFRIDAAKAIPEYVKLIANGPTARLAIESFCATTAGNIGISAGNLKTIGIPLPPIDVQRGIVSHLKHLESRTEILKTYQSQTSAALDGLLPSILDKAFKGEL